MQYDDIEHDELVGNYDALRADRDWSVAQMGDYIETIDPALAARYREQAAGKKAAKSDEVKSDDDAPKAPAKTAAPKGRRGAAKSDG